LQRPQSSGESSLENESASWSGSCELVLSRHRLTKRHHKVQFKTILNLVEKYKSFVYAEARWGDCDQQEIELYHQLGKLPEPESTHKFC